MPLNGRTESDVRSAMERAFSHVVDGREPDLSRIVELDSLQMVTFVLTLEDELDLEIEPGVIVGWLEGKTPSVDELIMALADLQGKP
jgi:acyl carrier protein